jgi:hypothetical protein
MFLGTGQGGPKAGATQTATATPTPKKYPALKGQRVYDAVSYRRNRENAIVLDDIRRVEITDEEKDQYSNDGMTLGDIDAADGVYSQILPPSTSDYVGGTTNFYLQRVITMLREAEGMDPLDFFGLPAMSKDRFSALPKTHIKVQEQMAKIVSVSKDQSFSGWAQTFLKDFRVDQKDPNSKFFPLYVPRYPEPPSLPPPPSPWKPYGHPELGSNRAGGANMTYGRGGMAVPYGMYPGAAGMPRR